MLKGKLNLMIHIYIYLTNLINCIFASKYDINIKDAYGPNGNQLSEEWDVKVIWTN